MMNKTNSMNLIYDGSFDGFLSLIFECYARKSIPEAIYSEEQFQELIFTEKEPIATNPENAMRVWKAWQKKLSAKLKQLPYHAFLSTEKGMEMKLLHFAQIAFSSQGFVERNYGDPEILDIFKAAKRVNQEAMRMLQFVRFQKTRDGIYFSGVRPRYDVLPMTLKHFQDRFADQHWLVYDMKRDYGYFYNQKTIEEIILNDKAFNPQSGKVSMQKLEDEESYFQNIWYDYCKSINIRERLNLKLQKQHMPKRYWKFLTEKGVGK